MAFFYKHKPKGFNYVPRYFDPAKEARERRKAELGLGSNQSHDDQFRAKMRGSWSIGRDRNDAMARRSKRTTAILLGVFVAAAYYFLSPLIVQLLKWLVGK